MAVDTILPSALPETGLGTQAALAALAPVAVDDTAHLAHPGYFAHMDPPAADEAVAAALWQVGTNQNTLHPDVAPSARLLERQVVEWLLPYFVDDTGGRMGGHIVPGSTVANLTALWAARDTRGVTKVLTSNRSHNSVRKAADLLCLDYEELEADPQTHALDAATLADAAARQEDPSTVALVLTAGTVAAGAIDSLDPPPGLGWLHVDAAWAGPMRLCTTPSAPSPGGHGGGGLAARLDGIAGADSVGFSAHKWLGQPKGCAFVFFRDEREAHGAMSYGGGYLAEPTVGILGSAPAAAVPLAATLLARGRAGIAADIERDVANADELARLVSEDDRFELFGTGPPVSGVVVWRPRRNQIITTSHEEEEEEEEEEECAADSSKAEDPGRFAAQLRADWLTGAWVSLTDIDGEVWFRSVAANPNADPQLVFDRVCHALEKQQQQQQQQQQ